MRNKRDAGSEMPRAAFGVCAFKKSIREERAEEA